MTMPGFTAAASLYEGRGYYYNRAGREAAPSHRAVHSAQAAGSETMHYDRATVYGPVLKCYAWQEPAIYEDPGPVGPALYQACYEPAGDRCGRLTVPRHMDYSYHGPMGAVRDADGYPLESICREPTEEPGYYYWRKLWYDDDCTLLGSAHYGSEP